MWADYPFPLISTPALHQGYTDQFVSSASKMALVHNIIIRGLNAIYLQCEYTTSSTASDFLTFCQCWSEMLHHHHECEDAAYFSIIEKQAGIKGLAEANADQHNVLMGSLRKFDDYVYRVSSSAFSGQRLLEILDTFAAPLQLHLADEVVWIASLSQYPHLDLVSIDDYHSQYFRSRSSKFRLMPYLLTNHDLTYEGGLHSLWPTGNRLSDWFLRYVCSRWHRGAWDFSSCTVSGKPRMLPGIKPTRSDVEAVKPGV
jgi:hemerythrin-like domain-containing protein